MKNPQRLLAGLLLLSCLSATVSASVPVWASDVTGKVVAVYHESVQVNQKWLDKVSVTIDTCAPNQVPGGQFATFSYSPGAVADDNALGFLFRDHANAARQTISKNQYMTVVGGHVTLAVNDQNKQIQKTTFWGHNWECGRNVGGSTASATGAGGGAGYQAPAAAPATQQPASKPKIGVPSLGRFGF